MPRYGQLRIYQRLDVLAIKVNMHNILTIFHTMECQSASNICQSTTSKLSNKITILLLYDSSTSTSTMRVSQLIVAGK